MCLSEYMVYFVGCGISLTHASFHRAWQVGLWPQTQQGSTHARPWTSHGGWGGGGRSACEKALLAFLVSNPVGEP